MGGRAEPSVCLSGAGGPQGTSEIKQGMGEEWDKKQSQSRVEIQLSKCLQRFFFIPFLLRFIYF